MMNKNTRRVVITGMGVVSPFGVGLNLFWDNLVKGNSGIKPITITDVSRHTVRFGGEITDFDPGLYIDKKEAKRMDRFSQLAMVAAKEAVEDSGLDTSKEDPTR